MILLGNQHAVIDYSVLFQDTIDGAAIYPREIAKATLKHGAAAVILSQTTLAGQLNPVRPINALPCPTFRKLTMLTSVKPLKATKPPYPQTLKTKLEARARPLKSGAAYDIYLNSLAASGRSSVATLPSQSILFAIKSGK